VKLGNRSTWRFPVQWTAEGTIQEGIRGQCQAFEACESQLRKDISLVLHSGLIPCSSQGLLLSALVADSAYAMLERTRKPFCRVSSLLVRISVHGVGKPRPMHVLPHGLRKGEDLATWNSCTPFVYAETGWIATAGRCYYVLDCRMTIASLVCCNLRSSSNRLRNTYSVVKLEAA
jgi:hypothetical protein